MKKLIKIFLIKIFFNTEIIILNPNKLEVFFNYLDIKTSKIAQDNNWNELKNSIKIKNLTLLTFLILTNHKLINKKKFSFIFYPIIIILFLLRYEIFFKRDIENEAFFCIRYLYKNVCNCMNKEILLKKLFNQEEISKTCEKISCNYNYFKIKLDKKLLNNSNTTFINTLKNIIENNFQKINELFSDKSTNYAKKQTEFKKIFNPIKKSA